MNICLINGLVHYTTLIDKVNIYFLFCFYMDNRLIKIVDYVNFGLYTLMLALRQELTMSTLVCIHWQLPFNKTYLCQLRSIDTDNGWRIRVDYLNFDQQTRKSPYSKIWPFWSVHMDVGLTTRVDYVNSCLYTLTTAL